MPHKIENLNWSLNIKLASILFLFFSKIQLILMNKKKTTQEAEETG